MLPGSSTDIISRLLGQKLTERLGQSVIVEQKVGGTGLIANDFVAKSAPDGYTMVLLTGGRATAAVRKTLPYHPVNDFGMVSVVISYPMVISVPMDSGGRYPLMPDAPQAAPDSFCNAYRQHWLEEQPGMAYKAVPHLIRKTFGYMVQPEILKAHPLVVPPPLD